MSDSRMLHSEGREHGMAKEDPFTAKECSKPGCGGKPTLVIAGQAYCTRHGVQADRKQGRK